MPATSESQKQQERMDQILESFLTGSVYRPGFECSKECSWCVPEGSLEDRIRDDEFEEDS